jgi:hypothetical protein
MKQLPLKRVEYCIPGFCPGSASAFGQNAAAGATHFHMANVSIDFENRTLSLAGDIGIKVSATIYPGFTAVLADELVFSLEGIIEDSQHMNPCSGLLVLDNFLNEHQSEKDKKGKKNKEWHATLYLYDDHIDGREIKLKLTMYGLSVNAELN